MKTVQLKNNIENAPLVKANVTAKQYKDLLNLQYSGGFKRFSIALYDENNKRTSKEDTKQLNEFLKTVFINTKQNEKL